MPAALQHVHFCSITLWFYLILKKKKYSATMIPALEGLLFLLFQSASTPSWYTGFVLCFAIPLAWPALMLMSLLCSSQQSSKDLVRVRNARITVDGFPPRWSSPTLLGEQLPWGWQSLHNCLHEQRAGSHLHRGQGLNLPEAPLTVFLSISIC